MRKYGSSLEKSQQLGSIEPGGNVTTEGRQQDECTVRQKANDALKKLKRTMFKNKLLTKSELASLEL